MAISKTRKSLAVGAASALVLAGFSALPASAAGLADKSFVSLAPTTGTAYTVVSGNGKTFSLTANEATSVAGAGRNVKFLVTDADSKIEPKVSGSTLYSVAGVAGNDVAVTNAGDLDVAVVTVASHTVEVGDVLSLAGFDDNSGGGGQDLTGLNGTTQTVTAVTDTTITFKGAFVAGDQAAYDGDVTLTKVRSARDAEGSYVVDSGVATDTTNETLILVQGNETTSRTVTVTAWVDANGNDTIDATEYTSETRTVTFKKASEITGTVSFDQPVLGDTALTASVTTSPTLNGEQVGTNMVHVVFTRQGIAGNGPDAAVWDATNGEWDASLSVQADTSAGVNGIAGTDWSGASAAVVAGTYTARPYILTTAIASAVSAVVGSTQADDVKATIAGTANNEAGDNETAAAATAVTARSGSSVTVTATVYDNSSPAVAVGAGIPVTATLSAVTGTIKVNGSATSDVEYTDANGKVTFTVTTATAAASQASDAATLLIQAQNVTTAAKQAKYTLTWDDATATLYDAAVANVKTDVNRSTTKNGTVNFAFRLVDQWEQPLAGSYRLKVANTGNTVNTNYVAVSGGAASVSVTDGQIGAGTSITSTITVEKDVDGTWTAQDLTNDGNTDGAADTVAYTIGILDQTDAVTLDADAATVYGSATADDSDAIAAKATVAQDTRSNYAAVPAYANDVVVTGRVAHATTAAVRAGAVVTISGTSDMLFSTGGVYAFGSLTFVTDSSGEFDVSVYSNKVQKDTVVTVSSNGASATKKVSFTTAGADSGASVSFAGTPAYAAPGSTFQVVATLVDAYGNTVDATNGDVSVTYSGPGITFGTLPTDTDANGQAKFAVLLGTNDTGTATITFSYDTNADGDVLDTGEFATSYTVTVGAAPADTKVNAGSFKGYVAIYAKGYAGDRLSAKVGKDWVVVASLASDFERVVEFTGAGYTINVPIYINRVLVDTITVTTK